MSVACVFRTMTNAVDENKPEEQGKLKGLAELQLDRRGRAEEQIHDDHTVPKTGTGDKSLYTPAARYGNSG